MVNPVRHARFRTTGGKPTSGSGSEYLKKGELSLDSPFRHRATHQDVEF